MKKIFALLSLVLGLAMVSKAQVQKEAANFISQSADKVTQLVDAVPDGKLSWSPDTGVRTFSQVFAHVAAANYMWANALGGTMPSGVNPMSFEKELTSKAALKSALKASFEYLIKTINSVPDASLNDKVTMPWGAELTKMGVILEAHSHLTEHLGQLIAYSRTNKITPPWSAK